jgi:hypothetical protein
LQLHCNPPATDLREPAHERQRPHQRATLGDPSDTFSDLFGEPYKPKGMRWRTFSTATPAMPNWQAAKAATCCA